MEESETKNSMNDSSVDDGEEKQSHQEDREQSQRSRGYHELEEKDDSRFHECIKEEDWDKLKKLLKRYKAGYYKKKRIEAREAEELKRQLEEEEKEDGENDEVGEEPTRFQRLRQFRPFKKKDDQPKEQSESRTVAVAKKVPVLKKMFVDPADVISPLLMVDEDGRTPLHLALIHKAPEKMTLKILEVEKKASAMEDTFNRVPLHYAIQSWQYDHVIERIVKINPHALKVKDDKGRTPIGLAVELAREGLEDASTIEEDPDSPFLWISPTSKEEKEWQFEQETRWGKVNCLLRELMNLKKSNIPSEHGLILEALEGGADPNTIIRFISTTDRYLRVDDELAATAIGLCVERHYTVDTLEYLMENCRDRTTIISDVVQKAFKSHYLRGCRPLREGMVPFGKRVIDWAKKQEREEKRMLKKLAKEKKNRKRELPKKKSVRFEGDVESEDSSGDEIDIVDKKRREWAGMKKTCRDWWEVLNHLIFYCAYGRDYDVLVKPKTSHLLHAALSSPMTPPSLIHLLLIVYPAAIHEKCPSYNVYPIHIASTRWRYTVIHNDNDVSSLDQVLNQMFELDRGQVYMRYNGGLPIHLALFGGQPWTFIRSQIATDKKLVGMRDASSRLFPFQIAALPVRFKNVQLLMRFKFSASTWREMSFVEKKIEYEKVVDEQKTRQLTTIFQLLRSYPDAIENRPANRCRSGVSRNLRSLSDVCKHYLSWVYGRNSRGGYRVRYENLTILRNSIIQSEILPELDVWWRKLKECIWNDSHSDIPKRDEYLLHAALYNCETPPLVTELLIQLFPSSTAKPIPGTSTFPLHIAAGTASYQRQKFEIPYGMNNLRLLLKAYKQATRLKSNGRLPLHICLARGKGWKEVRPLVMVDPSSLKIKDMQTGLTPFELIASFNLTSKKNSLLYSTLTSKQMNTFDFHELSAKQKAKALSRGRKKMELSQLTCIFELIRHRPSVFTQRCAGLVDDTDLYSVGSIESYLENGFEIGGEAERLEANLDDDVQFAKDGVRIELISPEDPNSKSIRSLISSSELPPLISPFLGWSKTSLTSSLVDFNQDPLELSRKKKTKKSKKPGLYREGTKAALFDFNNVNLSGFDSMELEDVRSIMSSNGTRDDEHEE